MIRCTFPHGVETSLRHVVIDVVLVKDTAVLFVKRAARLIEGGKWALVGGYVERNETTLEAARREVLEESGYEVSDLELLTIRDNPNRPNEDTQNISFVYVGRVGKKIAEHDNEVQETKWFELDQLPAKEEVAFDHYLNVELWMQRKNE